jgi:glycogen(starch) synthase
MHIAHITTLFDPHRGGIETMVLSLAHGLVRSGDRVSVVTRRTHGLVPESALDGIRIFRVGGEGGGRQLARLRFLWGGRRFFRRHSGRIDIVHAHSLYTPALLAAARPEPAVATVHTEGLTGNLADLRRRPFGRIRLEFYRRRLRRIIALTHGMVGQIEAAGFDPGRISVIPNGVDTERFVPPDPERRMAARHALGLPADGRVVAFLGRLVHEKGADVLLRGWPRIRRRIEGSHLLIAGRGEESVALRRAFDEGGEDLRWLPDLEDQRDLYQAADVLVVPSRAESFGLVALEGMAAGLPVVASRVGGLPEVAGDAALLVPPEDPASLADAVVSLLDDDSRRRHLARTGRERVLERFTLARVVARHRELYGEVVEEARSGG